jgi:hypothetical protein
MRARFRLDVATANPGAAAGTKRKTLFLKIAEQPAPSFIILRK